MSSGIYSNSTTQMVSVNIYILRTIKSHVTATLPELFTVTFQILK